jgi:glucose/arabinose dehydrogenase
LIPPPRSRAGAAAVALALLAVAPALAQEAPRSPTPGAAKLALKVTDVARGLEHPWGLAFLPDGRMLVTERPGRLRFATPEGTLSEPLTGVPPVYARGQSARRGGEPGLRPGPARLPLVLRAG